MLCSVSFQIKYTLVSTNLTTVFLYGITKGYLKNYLDHKNIFQILATINVSSVEIDRKTLLVRKNFIGKINLGQTVCLNLEKFGIDIDVSDCQLTPLAFLYCLVLVISYLCYVLYLSRLNILWSVPI